MFLFLSTALLSAACVQGGLSPQTQHSAKSLLEETRVPVLGSVGIVYSRSGLISKRVLGVTYFTCVAGLGALYAGLILIEVKGYQLVSVLGIV